MWRLGCDLRPFHGISGIGFNLSAVVPCSVLEFGGSDHSMFEKTA